MKILKANETHIPAFFQISWMFGLRISDQIPNQQSQGTSGQSQDQKNTGYLPGCGLYRCQSFCSDVSKNNRNDTFRISENQLNDGR